MKKIFCLVLSLLLIMSVFAGCVPKDNGGVSSVIASGETEFEKPESYASVVLVTINPQFRLYLDTNGDVLAVEPVNDDAKLISKNIATEVKNVQSVVQNLITAAKDGGFIKENATVDIKLTSKEEDGKATDVLNKIKNAVESKLDEIKVSAIVTAEISDDASANNTVSSDLSSSEKEASSETSSDNKKTDNTVSKNETEDKKPEQTSSKENTPAACSHTATRAVAISTGKNIIDSSKLDMVVHNVVCANCSEVIKTENHSVANGKCTVCNQDNFATKTVGYVDAGPTLRGDAEINDDGSVDYDIMLSSSWYSVSNGYEVDEWNYKIPEDVILKAIKNKFSITDAQFEALKAQGEYDFFLGDHIYKNGYFEISWPAAGGPGNFTHNLVGYKDDNAGNFTIYIDYIKGGADVPENELEHLYYYAVEYTYSGYSNLSIVTNEYDGKEISGYTPVIDSLRVKAIKKLSALPTDITNVK